MKKILTLLSLMFCIGTVTGQEILPDIREYTCDFKSVKFHIEVDENSFEDLVTSNNKLLDRGKVGKITKILNNGDLDSYDFFVLRGRYDANYMVGFFIETNHEMLPPLQDIVVLNIQTWEPVSSQSNQNNSFLSYTNSRPLQEGGIYTKEGICSPIKD